MESLYGLHLYTVTVLGNKKDTSFQGVHMQFTGPSNSSAEFNKVPVSLNSPEFLREALEEFMLFEAALGTR